MLENNKPRDFGPKFRLHFSWEYRSFFNGSQVFKHSQCVIFRIPNELGHFRVGMTFKARGSSLSRNRVKRQVREFFRSHRESLGSFDYNVVIPQSRVIAFPYEDRLRQCLDTEFLPKCSLPKYPSNVH